MLIYITWDVLERAADQFPYLFNTKNIHVQGTVWISYRCNNISEEDRVALMLAYGAHIVFEQQFSSDGDPC